MPTIDAPTASRDVRQQSRPARVTTLRPVRRFDHEGVVFATALLTLDDGSRAIALRTLNLKDGGARTFRLDERALALLEDALAEARSALAGQPVRPPHRRRHDDEPRRPGVPRGRTTPL